MDPLLPPPLDYAVGSRRRLGPAGGLLELFSMVGATAIMLIAALLCLVLPGFVVSLILRK